MTMTLKKHRCSKSWLETSEKGLSNNVFFEYSSVHQIAKKHNLRIKLVKRVMKIVSHSNDDMLYSKYFNPAQKIDRLQRSILIAWQIYFFSKGKIMFEMMSNEIKCDDSLANISNYRKRKIIKIDFKMSNIREETIHANNFKPEFFFLSECNIFTSI